MFAPRCARKAETAATIPGRSGQETSRRAVAEVGIARERYGRAARRGTQTIRGGRRSLPFGRRPLPVPGVASRSDMRGLEQQLGRAGAVFVQRDGVTVAAHFGSTAAELAVCRHGVGVADA